MFVPPCGEARPTGTATAVTTKTQRYIGGCQETTNLYKLGARYYDATTGRFTQFDPSGHEANPYAYAACNPINAKDPSGLALGLACGSQIAFGSALLLAGLVEISTDTFAAVVAAAPSLGASVAAGGALAIAIAAQIGVSVFLIGNGIKRCSA
jgi:RHS repeat-associated protein